MPMPMPHPEMPADEAILRQPLERLLERAVAHHRAGDLIEAERLYRAVLSQRPDHSDANHNLGVLTVATGHAAAALPYFQAAIQSNPKQGQFWLSCIDALIQANQIDAGRQMLNLGVQSGLRGDAVQALDHRLQKAVQVGQPVESTLRPIASSVVRPAIPPPQSSAVLQKTEQRKDVDVPKSKRERSRRNPRGPSPAQSAQLRSLFEQKRDREMEAFARSLLVRLPKSSYVWNMLGALRQRNSCFADAEACYRRALQAAPDCVEACFNLGRMLQERGELAEAESYYHRALVLFPKLLAAHYGLGEIFYLRSRFVEAEACYRRVIELQPGLAKAHNNLAIALRRQDKVGESEASCRRALELEPEFAEAFCNLGAALENQGLLTEAAASYRRALEVRPEFPIAHHSLLFCLSHGGEMEPEALFAEHLRFAERFESPLRLSWPRHDNSREPDRPLRVGFVSGDFRRHAMAHFMEPIFCHLAQDSGLSLHAYSNHAVEDVVTDRLRCHIPHWNTVFALSDEALAAKIRADGIDILVDLTGHTAHNRLLTFARKPAPVQCGWIGYLGTSGLKSIDYYLADRYFLPPGEFDRYFTEKIVYLPAVAPFQPSLDSPAINSLPALASGRFTFGSFSRLSKLNQSVIALWSQLLRALPESQILIGGMPRDGRYQLLCRWFEDEGIAAARLQFHLRCENQSYLKLHHQVDLCLDPFPFTGATTTNHALWMGVPTLTLAGQTVAGRLGPAMLHHVGLEDFVARDPRDFVEKGVDWARNLESLAQLRASMRERFLQSAIGQPEFVAQSLAAAFRHMWLNWCASGQESCNVSAE